MKNGGSFHSYVNVYQRVKPMKTWKISGSGSTWPGISHGFPWHRHGFPTCRIWPSCWSHMLGRTKRWKRLTSGVWRGTMNGKVWGNHGFVTGKSNGDFRLTPKLVFVHWFFQKLWFTKIVTGKPQFFWKNQWRFRISSNFLSSERCYDPNSHPNFHPVMQKISFSIILPYMAIKLPPHTAHAQWNRLAARWPIHSNHT